MSRVRIAVEFDLIVDDEVEECIELLGTRMSKELDGIRDGKFLVVKATPLVGTVLIHGEEKLWRNTETTTIGEE